jgi:hypothetical protein
MALAFLQATFIPKKIKNENIFLLWNTPLTYLTNSQIIYFQVFFLFTVLSTFKYIILSMWIKTLCSNESC